MLVITFVPVPTTEILPLEKLFPLRSSVALSLAASPSVNAPPAGRDELDASCSVPFCTNVPPLYVLVPNNPSTSVPVLSFVSEPDPLIAPPPEIVYVPVVSTVTLVGVTFESSSTL